MCSARPDFLLPYNQSVSLLDFKVKGLAFLNMTYTLKKHDKAFNKALLLYILKAQDWT